MIQTGLVSVTFRQLNCEEIVALVADAGLEGIEWGGDIHVPHGRLDTAREVRRMTEQAGLSVLAYGSYLKLCTEHAPEPADVVRTASALNAPVLRIWAGAVGSEAATPAHRRAIVESARMVGELAQEAGIEVAFEFHGNTLNDSARACRQLLEEIDHPNVGTYWQPLGVSDVAGRLTELDMILDRLSNVHAYQLDEDRRRLPLAEGGEAWTACLRRLVHTGRDHAVMLEFVRGDDPEAFRADAHTLQGWVNDLQSP